MQSPQRLRRIAPAIALLAGASAAIFVAVKFAPSRGVVVEADEHGAASQAVAQAEFEKAFGIGLAAFRRGDAHAAAVAFDAAAKVDPSDAAARVNLGFALVELELWDEARENFDAALQINPEQFNAYYGIAEALEGKGDIDQASGAMNTFLYYVGDDDPFRRKAEAALWEWGTLPVAAESAPDTPVAGEGFFDQIAFDLDGAPVRLEAFSGKTVVLNLWASWCPPCRRELPSLEILSDRLGDEQFAVVGLSVDSNPDLVREYLSRIGVDFRNLWDRDFAVARGHFGVNVYPTTYIIDADGAVQRRLVGYRDWSSDGIIEDIRQLSKDRVQK